MRAQLLSRALLAALFGICVALNIGTESQAIDPDDSSLGIPATTTFHHRDDDSLLTRRGRERREINNPGTVSHHVPSFLFLSPHPPCSWIVDAFSVSYHDSHIVH